MRSRLVFALSALVCLGLVGTLAISGPGAGQLTGGGGLTRVVHDSSATGSGTTAAPLSVVQLAAVDTARIIGRTSASTGYSEELTGTQATTLLDTFTSGLKGLAPASGGGTANYLRADGTWAPPPGGGALWSAGTYAAGSIVRRGPYLWMATTSTSEDPMVVEGNLGSASDWTVNTSASSGMDQSGTRLLLINNALGKNTAAFRQSTNTGFLGKMLIVDAQISGTADALLFGIYDSSLAQSASSL